jgi:hypothetical protein
MRPYRKGVFEWHDSPAIHIMKLYLRKNPREDHPDLPKRTHKTKFLKPMEFNHRYQYESDEVAIDDGPQVILYDSGLDDDDDEPYDPNVAHARRPKSKTQDKNPTAKTKKSKKRKLDDDDEDSDEDKKPAAKKSTSKSSGLARKSPRNQKKPPPK